MKFVITSFFLLGLLTGCGNGNKSQSGGKDPLPSCVQEQITALDKQPVANSPVQIDEYEYRGKKTYLFTADCCDQYNTLYDENCKSICAPSGGLTGKGDGKCRDFDSTAKHIRLVWKKAGK